MITFTPKRVDPNGMFLMSYADCYCFPEDIRMSDIIETFLEVSPAAVMDGYCDDAKGYNGDAEVGFMASDGTPFYCYGRYGRPRIGGRGGEKLVPSLVQFIENAVRARRCT